MTLDARSTTQSTVTVTRLTSLTARADPDTSAGAAVKAGPAHPTALGPPDRLHPARPTDCTRPGLHRWPVNKQRGKKRKPQPSATSCYVQLPTFPALAYRFDVSVFSKLCFGRNWGGDQLWSVGGVLYNPSFYAFRVAICVAFGSEADKISDSEQPVPGLDWKVGRGQLVLRRVVPVGYHIHLGFKYPPGTLIPTARHGTRRAGQNLPD